MSLSSNKNNNRAFTLAEVLITLGIIGVVAIMTIPTLIQNTQEIELKKAWKELYSQISQATNAIAADNNGTLVGVCDADSSTDSNYLADNSDCMMNLYVSKFKTVSSLYNYNSSGGWNGISAYKFLKGDTDMGNILKLSRFQISNGAIIYIYRFGNSNGCISVDVNGVKGPNTHGKDLFRIWIYPNTLRPAGWSGDLSSTTCDPSITGSGDGCSAKYLYDETSP